MTREWTVAEIDALPVVVDLVTGGSIFGLGRSASYELARRGEFPVPVLRVGHRYRVVTAHIRAALALPLNASEAGPATGPAFATTNNSIRPGATSHATAPKPVHLAS
jgi:hypothetical protein